MRSNSRRILFLMPHPLEGPSSRYRVYQYLPYLRDHGLDVEVRPFFSSRAASIIYERGTMATKIGATLLATLSRAADLMRAGRFDLVYVLREAFPFGPPFFEHTFKRLAGKMIFDFDDAIYTHSLAYSNPLDRLRDWNKTGKVIRLSNHVVVGSEYLGEYAREFAASDNNVSIIPTVVDTEVYCPPPEREYSERVNIGWIGTPRGSEHYLRPLLDTFKSLWKRHKDIGFTFVGAEPFETGDVPVDFKKWRLDEEVSDLQSFDIGIMPLTDDAETRGKCGFKLIQYMSVGIPVVCSPVGANLEIVREGETGFFVDSNSEWHKRLESLIEDIKLRRKMGERGRRAAVESYSLHVTAPRLLEIILGVLSEKMAL